MLLLLSTDFALPITETFPTGPPGTAAPAPEVLFDPRLGVLVTGFLLLAALDHAVVALPRVHRTYEGLLARSRNPFRWVEYSVSANLWWCSSGCCPTSPLSSRSSARMPR